MEYFGNIWSREPGNKGPTFCKPHPQYGEPLIQSYTPSASTDLRPLLHFYMPNSAYSLQLTAQTLPWPPFYIYTRSLCTQILQKCPVNPSTDQEVTKTSLKGHNDVWSRYCAILLPRPRSSSPGCRALVRSVIRERERHVERFEGRTREV